MSKQVDRLVCALADSFSVVPGSSFDYFCPDCGRRVMVAPSGQRLLERAPNVLIVCANCVSAYFTDAEFDIAGSEEEITEEMRQAIPNMRRYRN